MKSAVHTPIPQLMEMFGLPTDNFHKVRRLEPRMVEWLLTDPDEDSLLGMALVLLLARFAWIYAPKKVYRPISEFKGFSFK
jgi:hypothetical protein